MFSQLTKKVTGTDVDSPKVGAARFEYTDALEFEPCDFATGGISTP